MGIKNHWSFFSNYFLETVAVIVWSQNACAARCLCEPESTVDIGKFCDQRPTA